MPKLLFGVALAYVVMPFDIIPDVIPVLGQIDDALIVPALIWLALRLTPQEIVEEVRNSVG